MNLREYVDSARQFSKSEMEACARTGSCNQCGLCCVSFNDTLPISIPSTPDEKVELFRKKIGEVCPHLRSNGKGETNCAAHQMKIHPSLRHCDDWNGPGLNKHPALGIITDYQMLIDNFWVWAIHFATGEELALANGMVKKGLIHHVRLQAFDLGAATRLVQMALQLPELPNELLGLIQFGEIFKRSGPAAVRAIKNSCGLNKAELNPREREFMDKYLSA